MNSTTQITPLQEKTITQEDDIRGNRRRKMLASIVLQIVLPFLAVVLCWPAAWKFFNVNHAFEKTFVGADLLLLGALLAFAIFVEIWSEQLQNQRLKKIKALDVNLILSIALAFIFLFFYGLIKAKSLQYDFPTAQTSQPPIEVSNCVWFSLTGGVFAVFWSVAVTIHSYRKFLEADIADLRSRT